MSEVRERPGHSALRHGLSNIRNVMPEAKIFEALGLLADLTGTWHGKGFNLVARPDKHDNTNVFLELNNTMEVLKFEPVASPIPNRGFAQDDITLAGLTYMQQISDDVTKGALHIEPGFWITQSRLADPPAGPQTVSRLATIPHGNALLASGTVRKINGDPLQPDGSLPYNGSIFPSFNSTPFKTPGAILAAGSSEFDLPAPPPPAPPHGFEQYTLTNAPGVVIGGETNTRTPLGDVPHRPDFGATILHIPKQELVNDPIKLLQHTIAQQKDAGFAFSTVAINVATEANVIFSKTPNLPVDLAPPVDPTKIITVPVEADGGGIENTAFLQANANSALVYATFWIETLTHPDLADPLLQLQYAQMVLLNFPILKAPGQPLFSWPHVTVGTLHKVFG